MEGIEGPVYFCSVVIFYTATTTTIYIMSGEIINTQKEMKFMFVF